MSDSSSDALRQVFLLGYNDLKNRLMRRLGSAELASDALQDTWLRLEGLTPVEPVQQPKPYLLRMAYNIALKRLRGEQGLVTLDDAEAAIGLASDAPSAARIAEGRSDLEQLRQAVAELTPRRRDILFASRLDGIPLKVLAERHGISQRFVERELRRAVLHCAQRLDRKVIQRFGPQPREVSDDETSE